MCKCRPEVRTPWCGRPGCEAPKLPDRVSQLQKESLELWSAQQDSHYQAERMRLREEYACAFAKRNPGVDVNEMCIFEQIKDGGMYIYLVPRQDGAEVAMRKREIELANLAKNQAEEIKRLLEEGEGNYMRGWKDGYRDGLKEAGIVK